MTRDMGMAASVPKIKVSVLLPFKKQLKSLSYNGLSLAHLLISPNGAKEEEGREGKREEEEGNVSGVMDIFYGGHRYFQVI